jgi:3-oxoadipate enol-lactonase
MRHMTGTVKCHYQERGTGLPVVLIHGFPFDHTIWQAQAAVLSSTYRVITPDLRGLGQSPAPEGTYHMDRLAGDIFALLDDLGIERAVWVGHSMGGYITMAALRLASERIMGVGLVATHPHADSDEKRAQRLASAESVLQTGPAGLVSDMIKVLFAPKVEATAPAAQGIARIMSNTAPVGIAGALRGMAARPASVDTLRNLAVPAVVITGAEDQVFALDMVQRMAGIIPQARLVVIDGAGHMPMIEQPDATTAALWSFLESLNKS